jgi:hypothetical protein
MECRPRGCLFHGSVFLTPELIRVHTERFLLAQGTLHRVDSACIHFGCETAYHVVLLKRSATLLSNSNTGTTTPHPYLVFLTPDTSVVFHTH